MGDLLKQETHRSIDEHSLSSQEDKVSKELSKRRIVKRISSIKVSSPFAVNFLKEKIQSQRSILSTHKQEAHSNGGDLLVQTSFISDKQGDTFRRADISKKNS